MTKILKTVGGTDTFIGRVCRAYYWVSLAIVSFYVLGTLFGYDPAQWRFIASVLILPICLFNIMHLPQTVDFVVENWKASKTACAIAILWDSLGGAILLYVVLRIIGVLFLNTWY